MLNKLFKKISDFMNQMTIKTESRTVVHHVAGRNVSIKSRKVYVNGKLVESITEEDGNEITITWEGDLANLDCTSCTINGEVKGNVDATNVKCGNVGGDVDGTSVNCQTVHGKVDATSVKMGNNTGNIRL